MATSSLSDDPLRSVKDLRAHIEQLVNSLFLGFMRILDHGVIEGREITTTSQNQYQLQIDTAKLIRSAEDILTLTRRMQELWLQGHLKTAREVEKADGKLEGDVEAVAEMLDVLIRRRDGMLSSGGAESSGLTAMEV